MIFPVKYVDIRLFSHATEDETKVKQAALNLFPEEYAEEVEFKTNALKGHYKNPILLFETRLKKPRIIDALIKKLSTNLTKTDKEKIRRESHLFFNERNLYLRLDKQAAYSGKFRLLKNDPIHLRIHFNSKNIQRIEEICQEIGLI